MIPETEVRVFDVTVELPRPRKGLAALGTHELLFPGMTHEVRIEGALEGKLQVTNGALKLFYFVVFRENVSPETRAFLKYGLTEVTSGVNFFVMNQTFFTRGKPLFALDAGEVNFSALVGGFAFGYTFVQSLVFG